MTSTALWLDTDEGLAGISMARGGGALLKSMANNLLVGKDPRGVLGHWNAMVDHVFKGGNRGPCNGSNWSARCCSMGLEDADKR